MNYRNFKGTPVSEIGLGTWQLGSADWGVIDRDEAFTILSAFIDAGGNFIDTADVYGLGVSESLIGEFLKTRKETIHVATKLGRRHDNGNGWPQNFTYDNMRRHIEDSLKLLGVEQLFLEQLHCIPTEELRSGEVFNHLRRFQEEGLIEHWGVSVETLEEALICLEQEGISSLQVIFNIFRQHIADALFPKANDQNVALIARVPLASGLLTGKFSKDTRFESADHRNFNANGESFNVGETFSGIEFSNGIELAEHVKQILPEGNMAQQSLRWILDFPEITTVIPGASRTAQVHSNLAAAGLPPLDSKVHNQLRSLYDSQIRPLIRGKY